MKKKLALLAALAMLFSLTSCGDKSKGSGESKAETTTAAAESESDTSEASEPEGEDSSAADKDKTEDDQPKYVKYASMTPEEIVSELTLEEKAAQMVEPAIYNLLQNEPEAMQEKCYGSVLSNVPYTDYKGWQEYTTMFQQQALDSPAGIPMLYGNDAVHGVNYCYGAVYFPQNIGQGAANDEELAYQVGLITANETLLARMPFTFSPVVAQSVDPRWGRTYESYGSDLDIITKLSVAYTKGLIDGGAIACPKHFFGDGNVVFGTGEKTEYECLIDRGDAQLSDEEIEKLLAVYQAQIDAGAQTIMISHSSLNGLKMHENKEYIMKLKDEMGFEGFIISDWNSVQNLPENTYEEQVITAVNSGIDMLMEPDTYNDAMQIIIDSVNSGKIPKERVDDAVTRIIKVKKDIGLFDDPMFEKKDFPQKETGSGEYRKVAEKMVEESLVLVKNENDTLPIKEGAKVYITGPAADNASAQCGGWTVEWQGISGDADGVTTLQDAFLQYSDAYDITVITDPEQADEADVVVLAVGEQSYAEWYGDTDDLGLCGALGLDGNRKAIDDVKKLGKPTVACIFAGRNVIIDDKDLENWDSAVMCYLPGSEGKGMSDVLCGCADFQGRLPSKWYGSVDEIGTEKCRFDMGYGLTYGEGFTPRPEPGADTAADISDKKETGKNDPTAGTAFKKGEYKDGNYVNSYAGVVINVPEGFTKAPESVFTSFETNYAKSYDSDSWRSFAESSVLDDFYINSTASDYIQVQYLNTKTAFPDNVDITEEELLDFFEPILLGSMDDVKAEDRKSVELGGRKYLRSTLRVKNSGINFAQCIYVSRIDDDMMCFFVVQSASESEIEDPYYFEKCF